MVRRRIPLIACAAGALWLSACSSDTPSNNSANSADTSTTVRAVLPVTTTTAPVSAVTTAAATTTTIAGTGSTTVTTVKARVVTSPSDNVKLGDSGKGVEQIQAALKQAGYKVTVDGQFGPQTDTAVRAFQKKNGLTVDGVVGPKTWAKLSGASTSGSTATTAAAATSTTTSG